VPHKTQKQAPLLLYNKKVSIYKKQKARTQQPRLPAVHIYLSAFLKAAVL
jgi:hypothetical protein